MWEWTIPQIVLATYDYTHVKYYTEKEAQARKKAGKTKKYENPRDFANDLGIPIL